MPEDQSASVRSCQHRRLSLGTDLAWTGPRRIAAMRAPCPDRQRPLTGRLLYFGGFLAPAFIAFAASARFSAHRFFVAAMILAIPSLLKRRFGFGALAGADGSDSPRILAHQIGKSTRLNSSHRCISYAVFCLK